MVDYSSLISTSVHILCFKLLGESLQLIFSLLGQVSVDKVTSCPAVNQDEGVSTIYAPLFAKMEMGMQMDFSSGSDTNTGVIISGGKDIDTFLQSKNPQFL